MKSEVYFFNRNDTVYTCICLVVRMALHLLLSIYILVSLVKYMSYGYNIAPSSYTFLCNNLSLQIYDTFIMSGQGM